MEWCKTVICRDTVTIREGSYNFTVFYDTCEQQSACRKMTGKNVRTGKGVLCQGVHSFNYYSYMHIELVCPIVTPQAQVAVADVLTVDGVDFLLGNDFSRA